MGRSVMGSLKLRQRVTSGFWLTLFLLATGVVAGLGPPEKSLGVNVRIVYLHGALVWTALAGFGAAGLAGLMALTGLWQRGWRWSAALGRSGLMFWIAYLPVSLWAMQANWNGLFLAEPRWRLAAIFAVSGILLQVGLALLRRPKAYAWGNLGYILALIWMLSRTEDVLHPKSPIFNSESSWLQIYFLILLLLTLAAGWQMARLWLAVDNQAEAS